MSPSSYADTLPAAAMVDQALAVRIDASISRYYKPADPGASVIVTKDGQTVFRKAYGMADVAKHVAMTLRIGSITKQFTSTAIMMLAGWCFREAPPIDSNCYPFSISTACH